MKNKTPQELGKELVESSAVAGAVKREAQSSLAVGYFTNGQEQNLKALQELKEMLLKPKPIELLYKELLTNIGKKGKRIEMEEVETPIFIKLAKVVIPTVCLSTKMNISYIGKVHTSPMIIVHFFENNTVCIQEVGVQGRLYLDINEAIEVFE